VFLQNFRLNMPHIYPILIRILLGMIVKQAEFTIWNTYPKKY